MSLLKEIHVNAAVAWSPVRQRAELIALGSKGDGGVAFENTGGEFKLVSMSLNDPSTQMKTLGSVKTPSRFTSLAWRDISKHHDACPFGVVAGGMADGSVTLWNPKAMIEGGDPSTPDASCEIGRVTRHKGAVNAVQFNPHDDSAHLLASGGSDGEVYIIALDKLNAPAVFTPGGGSLTQPGQPVNEITSVAWNTQVNYILATGSQNGCVMIWDLKQKKPWCELRDPQRGTISAIAWNPNEGLQIATASGDDQRPVVKLWDLRNSTTTPLAEFHDHSAGVLSLSWCLNDPGLILSCGKDNRTLLWDLYTRRTVYEFPADRSSAPSMGSDQFFGGGASSRRWNVQWAPKLRAIASACTLDGKVQVWGLSGGGNAEVRPPKWIRRPAAASFGFGGKLVVVSNPREPAGPNTDRRRLIHIHRIASDVGIVNEAQALDNALETKDFKGHCERKIANAITEKEQSVWSFMKILFEKDARQHLLLHLGLDAEQINQLNAKFNPSATPPPLSIDTSDEMLNQRIDSNIGAEDVFAQQAGVIDTSSLASMTPLANALPVIEDNSAKLDISPTPLYTEQSESTLMQALLVGNFEVAVNCCLHYKQFADALLLASCGGPELWEKTQRAFFAQQTRPVMKVVSAIIKNELHSLVEQADLMDWRQTLAILSTYAKSEEFPSLCDKLAARLEGSGDLHSATLCFMCAVNVEKTVSAWVKECDMESKEHGHIFALQRLIEKVSIFSQAVEQPDQSMGPEVASRFAEYSSLMAAQGRLDIAGKYARFSDISCAILRDRIFHAAPIPGYQPPPFPFDVVNVVAQTAQQQQPQAYGKQGYGSHHQAAGQYGTQGQAHTAQYGAQAAGQFGAAVPGQAASATYGAAQPAGSYQQQTRAAATPVYNRTTSGGQPGHPAPQPTYGTHPTQPSYPGQPQPTTAYGNQPQQTTGYSGQPQPSYGSHPTNTYVNQPQQGGGFGAPQPHPGAGYGTSQPSPNAAGYGTQPSPGAGYGTPQPSPGGYGRPAQPGYPSQPASAGFSPSVPAGYNAPSGFGATPAVPQSTGVNPLTAHTSSSRISKPSVDMNSHKKDGFVSSVGNKELTLKYGNATTATLSPMGSATDAPNKFENITPGSTENVTPQDMPIVEAFNELIAQLQSLPLTMMEQKQLPEIQKSKEIMFTKLNISDLSPSVIGQLHQMAACFTQRDFATAQSIYVALTGSDWGQHKDWLRGLKSLIHISMKRFR